MFAMKDTREQTRHFASSSKKRHGNFDVARRQMVNPSQFLQRHLGNSYLQSTAESHQVLGQASTQNAIPTIQRKCACGGSCASCGGKEEERKIQTKLTIGAADDVYEQEADRVANQIMRMPDLSTQTDPGQFDTGYQHPANSI